MKTRKNSSEGSFGEINPAAILEIMSNETRRKILSVLSEEPMYFNQLARKINIGQQAVLRHISALEKSGILGSYEEKSSLGAPNRRYYKVRTTFSLNVSLTKNSLSIASREIVESRSKGTLKLYKYLDSLSDERGTRKLIFLKDSLSSVEDQIIELEEKINDLNALKEKLLSCIHVLCHGTSFDDLEGNIIYNIVKGSPPTVSELIRMVDTTEKEFGSAISSLYDKLDVNSSKKFLTRYRRKLE
jgi:ArsR family transcriptional regulator